eukprot:366525-Chlamydomonas_euryale.AAC.18
MARLRDAEAAKEAADTEARRAAMAEAAATAREEKVRLGACDSCGSEWHGRLGHLITFDCLVLLRRCYALWSSASSCG